MSFFSYVFIGDTHGHINDFKKQKKIIEKFTPEYVLSEQLQNIKIKSQKQYNSINLEKYANQSKLIEFCKNRNIKLIGIDLKNFGLNSRLSKIVNGVLHPTKKDELKIHSILKKRSELHIKNIKKIKSKKTIAIIVGAWHLRPQSLLYKSITNSLLILPVNQQNEPIYLPSETKEKIRYKEFTIP